MTDPSLTDPLTFQPEDPPTSKPNLTLPPRALTFDLPDLTHVSQRNRRDGSTTAPVVQNERTRFFSFGNHHQTLGSTSGTSLTPHAPRRQRYLRQNTVSGEASVREFPQLFSRAISRTYTLTSNASSVPTEEWRPIFDKLDLESDGKLDGFVPIDKFRKILEDDPIWADTVPKQVQEHILEKADRNRDGTIDFSEFIDLVRGTNIGFSRKKRRAFRELLKQTVEFIVPYKYSYQNQYSCSPPPVFMIVISLVQLFVFVYNSAVMYRSLGYIGLNGPVPYCSRLIYDPDKREQVWRFVTYMFIHSGIFHAAFNILIQLVLGIPLEMVHGWWRVALVYISGVLAGSLWTSVLRPNVFLSGASGGVYALITAHLGTVIMNFREMTCPWCRILIVSVVAFTDVIVYIYDIYVVGRISTPVSYPAHISGAITGLLVGITVLKNLRWESHERYIWAVSVCIFVVLMLVAILWNLAVPDHFTGLTVQFPECISKAIL